jgi:hypothetical protein
MYVYVYIIAGVDSEPKIIGGTASKASSGDIYVYIYT